MDGSWKIARRGLTVGLALVLLAAGTRAEEDPYQRGRTALVRKQYDEAITAFNLALRSKPTDGLALSNRGDAYYNKKEYDKALADFSEAIKLDGKNALALKDRAGSTWP